MLYKNQQVYIYGIFLSLYLYTIHMVFKTLLHFQHIVVVIKVHRYLTLIKTRVVLLKEDGRLVCLCVTEVTMHTFIVHHSNPVGSSNGIIITSKNISRGMQSCFQSYGTRPVYFGKCFQVGAPTFLFFFD